jgi:DNA-binding CsgD family transcriptional regulator
MVFDIDRPAAMFAAEDANVAPPNWWAVNPKNGHAHCGYELEVPIVTSEAGRDAPVQFAVAIEHAYLRALGADAAYSGLLVKNPMHHRWWTHIHRVQPYDLAELHEWVDLPVKLTPRQAEETSLGRNVRLFDSLRHWAYRNVRRYERRAEWALACHAKAGELNVYATPLSVSEVLHIARSVEKWMWLRFDQAASDKRFRDRQAARGRRNSAVAQVAKGRASGVARLAASEDKRSSARLMRGSGMTQAAIAAELGVTERTIRSWQNG